MKDKLNADAHIKTHKHTHAEANTHGQTYTEENTDRLAQKQTLK